MEELDPLPYRRAAGLTSESAAALAHVANSTWVNWERNGTVTARRIPRVRDMLLREMRHRIEVIQQHIDELESAAE